MNIDRFNQVLKQITEHPETHDQKNWHTPCGTSHCFAGWAQIFSGKQADRMTASLDAREWLDINIAETRWLFDPRRTLEDFEHVAKQGSVFDHHGYTRGGYDAQGRDRNGYDRVGYRADGYDRDGFNREGYNRKGYDREGYNAFGRDSEGFNSKGYDRDGFHRDDYPKIKSLVEILSLHEDGIPDLTAKARKELYNLLQDLIV